MVKVDNKKNLKISTNAPAASGPQVPSQKVMDTASKSSDSAYSKAYNKTATKALNASYRAVQGLFNRTRFDRSHDYAKAIMDGIITLEEAAIAFKASDLDNVFDFTSKPNGRVC